MQLYLDLDNVFADFDQRLKDFGVHRNDQSFYHQHYSTWTEQQTELSKRVCACMETEGFWEGIPLCPDAYTLWDYCIQYNPIILTAIPSQLEWWDRIKSEKQRWIENYLGFKTSVIYCLRAEKQQYAEGNILLDDNRTNIQEWNDAGGFGILHTSVQDSIEKLKFIYKEVY